jgi:vitamin B12 transporter
MLTVLLTAFFLTAAGADSLAVPAAQDSPADSASIADNQAIPPQASNNLDSLDTRDSLKVYKMKGTVVTASRTALPLRAAPASVSVVEYDSLAPGVAASAQLSQLPGASLGANGGLGSVATLSLRGGEANSTLYLLDGLPLNSAQNGQFDLNKIYDIQRIEIVRGPASSLYGANAASGVVNIITGGQAVEKPYSKITYEKGSYKSQIWDASVSLPLAQWAWAGLGMAWKKTGGHRTNSDYDGTNYFLSLGARPHQDIEAKLYYKEYKSECGAPGPDSLYYPDSLRWLYQPTPNDRQYDKEKDITIKVSYKDQSYIAVSRNSIDNEFYSQLFGQSRNYTLQTNVDGQYNKIWLPGVSTTAGGSYQSVESEITGMGKPEIQNKAAFLILQTKPINGLLFIAGGRYDKNSAYPSKISPSLSASYQIISDINIHASYGQGFRAPVINDIYWPMEVYPSYYYAGKYNINAYSGNKNLRAEASTQYEVGLKCSFHSLNLSSSIFQRSTKDLIDWSYSEVTITIDSLLDTTIYSHTYPINRGRAISTGLELATNYSPWKWITFGGNYCYSRTYQDTAGRPKLPYKPQHTANASLSINDYPIVPNLKLGWKFWVQYSDIQITGSDYPINLLPTYTISNQVLSLKIVDARVYYRVENLFNANYQTRYGYPMPRRTHSFGVIFEMWD